MTRAPRRPRGLTVAGFLLPWLATMLLMGSVPYLALYMGWVPGTDFLTEAGIEVQSRIGAVLALAGALLAAGTLAWSLVVAPLKALKARRQNAGTASKPADADGLTSPEDRSHSRAD